MDRGIPDKLQPECDIPPLRFLEEEIGGDNPANAIAQNDYINMHNGFRRVVRVARVQSRLSDNRLAS
jgi:hypothetical protein